MKRFKGDCEMLLLLAMGPVFSSVAVAAAAALVVDTDFVKNPIV